MSEFINQLKAGTEKIPILRSFQYWISSNEHSALVKLATSENFDVLFTVLYEAQPEEILLASEILCKFISVTPVSSRIPFLHRNLLRGLEHESSEIKEIILRVLITCAQDNAALEHLSRNQEFALRIARLVGDDNITVGTSSCGFLVSLGRDQEAAALILSPPVGDVLKSVMSSNETLKFRVYEVVVKIASSSPANLALVAKHGYFESLNADMKAKDDLLVMNCFEVVKDLAIEDHGLKHLHHVGFMKAASDLISVSLEPPQSFIILPGLLKFFVSVGQYQPEYVFHNHNAVIQFLFGFLDSADEVILFIAIDAVGLLGSTMQGKILLQNEGKMPCVLQSFRTHLQQGSTPEIKFHVMQALSRLLDMDQREKNLNPDFENVLGEWFKQISEDPGNLLFQLCRQPFLEIRQMALCLLRVVVSHEWGQRVMASVPGFVEFILDRSTEGTTLGKELKFNIVHSFVGSPSFERIFDAETVHKMKDYDKRGPFHVTAQSAIAVDEPV